MDWVGKSQNYKNLYGILQLLRGSHLHNFQLKTLKRGWVTFHSITFQLKCLDFQSNQFKKLVPLTFLQLPIPSNHNPNNLFHPIFTPFPTTQKTINHKMNKVRPLKKKPLIPPTTPW